MSQRKIQCLKNIIGKSQNIITVHQGTINTRFDIIIATVMTMSQDRFIYNNVNFVSHVKDE